MRPLTPRLAAKLAALFSSEDRPFAEKLLVEQCGDNLAIGSMGENGLERIRTAALKVSCGSLDGLARGISLAQSDWRDLLMGAGFGEDVRAHDQWLAGSDVST